MYLKHMNRMENWEKEVDNIDWKLMLDKIDQALIDNPAAEIGFPSFERLEQASGLVVDDHYICHISDGRWVWWNPKKYASEDPTYFQSKEEAIQYIEEYLDLDEAKVAVLREGLDKITQTQQCEYCDYEFNPNDPRREEWDTEQQGKYCSAECAMKSVYEEMKES